MGLSQALGTAMSGLRVAQAGMSLVASNVANAETPGYVKKNLVQATVQTNGSGASVRVAEVNRELDIFLQRQLQVEVAGGAYADTRAQFYARLQAIYGDPGSDSGLAGAYNKFTTALQGLAASPDSPSVRTAALSAAQVLTQQLHGMTDDVQRLRAEADGSLSAAVQQANAALQQIARINAQIATSNQTDTSAAALLDQRDQYIAQLSSLMDIRVVEDGRNQVSVFTGSGVQLVGVQASQLAFNAQGNIGPTTVWSADPQESGLGSVMLKSPDGADVDLFATKAIRSGRIAALAEMRDAILPQAQAQLDEIAAAMARALSDKTVAGAPASSGAQTGFAVDIGGLLNGNSVSLTYTDAATNAQRQVTIIRVDDPAALPLSNDVTANPNDRVIGVDFSAGLASVVSQLNAALGYTGLQFSNPSGSLLQALDDGLGNRVNVDALSATQTTASLTGGGAECPLFLDGNALYTGALGKSGSQSIGLAGRISVNAALIADPSRLVIYRTSPPVAAGDATRPSFIYDRLSGAQLDFSPSSGVGTRSTPFTGSISAFMSQVIGQQGEAAATASSLAEGQDIVVKTLQQRFDDSASVNIDEEMANLLRLQTAYGANARVMTTVRDMLDMLMRM